MALNNIPVQYNLNFFYYLIPSSYSFKLLKFHDFPQPFPRPFQVFHDPDRHLFSKYCQNNLLFTVFSPIMMHQMHYNTCIYLLLELKKGFSWLECYCFNIRLFAFLFSESCFSITFQDPHFNFIPFQAWEIKSYNFPAFPWPVWTLLLHEEFATHNFTWCSQKLPWT